MGWQPHDGGLRNELKKKVVRPEEDVRKDCLETVQRNIEDAAIATKLERDKDARRVPSKFVAEEGAAAKSSRAVERRVLRRQARQARAEHLAKCSLAPGKRKVKESL